MTEISNRNIKIEKWEITFIPICNPKAYLLNKRYYQKNLNRIIKKHKETETYEEKLANILIGYIQKADYILDIHSMKSNGVPFVFQDYDTEDDRMFCKNIWLEYIIIGWPDLYIKENNSDTIGYANKIGKIWAVIECGRHEDPGAELIAYQSIINTLTWLWIIKKQMDKRKIFKIVEAIKIIRKEKEGNLAKDRNHMDKVEKWDIIATYTDGETVYADLDGYILLPKEWTGIWEEWLYIGK